VKEDVLLPALCVLLFTNMLVAADERDIAVLVGYCAGGGGLKACNALDDAIRKLKDQASLARVAIETRDWNVRQVAVARLTDQALLAKIAAEDARAMDASQSHVTRNAAEQRLLEIRNKTK